MDDSLCQFFEKTFPCVEKENREIFKKTVIETYISDGIELIQKSENFLFSLTHDVPFREIYQLLKDGNCLSSSMIRILGTSCKRGHVFMRYCYALLRNKEDIINQDDFANSISIEVLASSFMTDLKEKIAFTDLLAIMEALPFDYEKTLLPAVSMLKNLSSVGKQFYQYFLDQYPNFEEERKKILEKK